MSSTILDRTRLPWRLSRGRKTLVTQPAAVRPPAQSGPPLSAAFDYKDYSDDDLPPMNTVVRGSNLFSWLVGHL